MDIRLSCNKYLSGFKDIYNYKTNSRSKVGWGVAKVVSYALLFPPLIAWCITKCVKHKTELSPHERRVSVQGKAILGSKKTEATPSHDKLLETLLKDTLNIYKTSYKKEGLEYRGQGITTSQNAKGKEKIIGVSMEVGTTREMTKDELYIHLIHLVDDVLMRIKASDYGLQDAIAKPFTFDNVTISITNQKENSQLGEIAFATYSEGGKLTFKKANGEEEVSHIV